MEIVFMFNVETKIDADGFWYRVETNQEGFFTFYYFAIGSQGKFCTNKIQGNTRYSNEWQFCKNNFPILHLGITSFTLSESDNEDQTKESNRRQKNNDPVDISRRKMINQTVAALLVGGAVLPALFENSEVTQYKPYSPSNPYPKYSPYTAMIT